MNIKLIPNMNRFLKLVDESKGQIFLQLPDCSYTDLKTDNNVRQLLRMTSLHPAGIDIAFSDMKDKPRFIQYLMEACYC